MKKIYCAMLIGGTGVFGALRACEKGKEASSFRFPVYTLGKCAFCGDILDQPSYPDETVSARAFLRYSTIGGCYHFRCAKYFLHERMVIASRFYAAALAKNEENLKDWQKRSGKDVELLKELLAKKVKLEKMYKFLSEFIAQDDVAKKNALEKMLVELIAAQERRDG